MELGATLVGQMITFAIFVWFTMRFIWPLLTQAMEDRQKKIADGLAAAQQGQQSLENAKQKSEEIIKDAKEHSDKIIHSAKREAQMILEECKEEAHKLREQIVESGRHEVEQAANSARSELRGEVSDIVLLGVKNILGRSVNTSDHKELLDSLANKVSK